MEIHIHIHHHPTNEGRETDKTVEKIFAVVSKTHKNVEKTMATQAEHAQALQEIIDQNEKARVEILAKITDLETAIANAGNTSVEVDEKVAALKASVQTDDDIVADAPVEEPLP